MNPKAKPPGLEFPAARRMAAALVAMPLLFGGVSAADEPRHNLPLIDVPTEEPPVAEKPFGSKEWMESMTIPVGRHRFREAVSIGDRGKHKRPLILIPAGSSWSGSGSGKTFISFGRMVARKSSFEKFRFESDHACESYFLQSQFDDCLFHRGGIWWGGLHPAKFYFENCLFSKGFMGPRMKVEDYGIRADRCVFVGVKFGEVKYEKHQPAKFVNERWFKFVNCRFVRCSLPSSVLLQTLDCVFEECTFVDDSESMAEVDEFTPMEVSLYARNCRNRISKLPAELKLIEKPADEVPAGDIPTAENVLTGE